MGYKTNEYMGQESRAIFYMEDGKVHEYSYDDSYEELEERVIQKIKLDHINPFVRIDYVDREKYCRSVYLNKSKIKEIHFFEVQ
jgi:hypothetical protein